MNEFDVVMKYVKEKHGATHKDEVAETLGVTIDVLDDWEGKGRVEYYQMYKFLVENIEDLNAALSGLKVTIKVGEEFMTGVKSKLSITRPAPKDKQMLFRVREEFRGEWNENNGMQAVMEKQNLLNMLRPYFVNERLEAPFWEKLIYMHGDEPAYKIFAKIAIFLIENMEYIKQPRQATRTLIWMMLEYKQQRLLEDDKEGVLEPYDFKSAKLSELIKLNISNIDALMVISNIDRIHQGLYDIDNAQEQA